MQNILNKYSKPFLLLLLSAAIFGCGQSNQQKTIANNNTPVIADSILSTLTTDTVSMKPYSLGLTLTGQVDFDEDHMVKVFPMVSGIAGNITVALGDKVQKGQVLGIISSADMASYSNDLANAEASLKIAAKNKQVTESMFRSGMATVKDSLTAAMEYQQAKSNLEKSKRVLNNFGGSGSGNYSISSPISGFVVEKNVTNGTVIRPDNSANLFTISNLNQVWVMANVYESNIPYIKIGDSVDIKTLSYPDKIFRGKVDKILNILDPQSRVMKVRIVMNNPGYLLKPQMFTSVIVNHYEDRQMIAIPSSALIFDNSQYYVLLYNGPHNITITPVEINGTNGDQTYISNGLKQGQVIITKQTLLIYQSLNS